MKTGWDAREMHQANQRKMNYVSTFNELEFTTPLEMSSPGYKQRVSEAERIARLIEFERKKLRKPLDRSEEERYGTVLPAPVISMHATPCTVSESALRARALSAHSKSMHLGQSKSTIPPHTDSEFQKSLVSPEIRMANHMAFMKSQESLSAPSTSNSSNLCNTLRQHSE